MQPRITELCNKCLDQTASETERQELLQLLTTPGFEEEAAILLKAAFLQNKEQQSLPETSATAIITSILQGSVSALHPPSSATTQTSKKIIPLRKWAWAAAAAIVLFVAGGYLWYQQSNRQQMFNHTQQKPNVQPGKDGAVLTLADGTQVVLDSLGNGLVATQNGSSVVLHNGQLAYDAKGKSSEDIVYNTMTTPRGRQFHLTLSDGTKVWLNAASSIKYPAVFSAGKRQVEITGEAYFEVAKDKKRPFLININNKATAEVLGTTFNVNAYEDESSINTTLLEGSLIVAANDQVILTPGQQARVAHAAGIQKKAENIVVVNADLENVMAWKKGFFRFEGLTMQEAMLQLARWYDIEVVYDTAIDKNKWQNTMLAGEIRRDLTLADVTDLLKELGLHCRIEGKQLIVLP